jgi:hypothetical protein
MPANRIIRFLWFAVIILPCCVEPFTPEIKESQNALVVEGFLTDQPGIQSIGIYRASPFSNPMLIPDNNCEVRVADKAGNIYQFYTYGDGVYRNWMTELQLVAGTAYKLIVNTIDGNQYESDYQTIPSPSPSIDSLYFEIETVGTSDPEQPLQGIQFYIDIDAGEGQPRNYMWELVETFEYHSDRPATHYYDGVIHGMPDPYLYYYCWYTGRIKNIFTATTKYSDRNRIMRYPLYYVSNQTDRLKIKYSLLVKQYCLGDDAFNYWDQMRKQQQEGGGLYETQPSQLKGNVYNVNDPSETVLGYFSVSSSLEERIFADVHREIFFPAEDCELIIINSLDQMPVYNSVPIYLFSFSPTGGFPYGHARRCFDCTMKGGSNVRPSFWN